MAKLIEGGKRTKYDSYDEYVNAQDARSHDYDCPNCLKSNRINVQEIRKRNIQFKTLLDIGCRDAAYFDDLMKEGIVCKGIDISPKSVAYTKLKGRDVIIGDVAYLTKLFDIKFDLIISNHTLEHFLKPEKAMEECYNILSDTGHMLIKLPNEGEKIKDTKYYAHCRTYNANSLRTLLHKFNIIHFELTKTTNEFFIIVNKVTK